MKNTSPYHTHHREDEAFYVVEGEMAFVRERPVDTRQSRHLRLRDRATFRTVSRCSATRRLGCCCSTSGGFDQFVVELSEPAPAPPDMAKLMTVAATYHIDILGPLPELPSELAPSSESLKEAAARVRARHVVAYHCGDPKQPSRFFGARRGGDAAGQPALAGPSLRAWMSAVLGNFTLQGFDLRPSAVEQHGNVVIEHGTWTATFTAKNGLTGQPAGGTYLTTYARLADGSVRSAARIFNVRVAPDGRRHIKWSAMSVGLSDADSRPASRRAIAPRKPEMCRRMRPRIRLYGLRHLRSSSAADDLAQQVLLTVLEALRACGGRRTSSRSSCSAPAG